MQQWRGVHDFGQLRGILYVLWLIQRDAELTAATEVRHHFLPVTLNNVIGHHRTEAGYLLQSFPRLPEYCSSGPEVVQQRGGQSRTETVHPRQGGSRNQ